MSNQSHQDRVGTSKPQDNEKGPSRKDKFILRMKKCPKDSQNHVLNKIMGKKQRKSKKFKIKWM